MKLSCLSRATGLFGCLLLLFATSGQSAEPQVLHGHVPAAVKSLPPLGALAGTNRLSLAIGLPLRNQAALSNLLQQIYDPASPNYHHYLTPEEFTAQFGPTEGDYQKVINFAQASGLTVTRTHGNRILVDVTGKISDVEKAFHTTLRTYRHPKEARDFFAPDTEPSVDSSVPVLHVSGLDNYSLPKPLLHKRPVSQATPAVGSGPSGSYMGQDFRNAYVPGTSLDGSGQMVGLLQFNSGFYQSDITAYETQTGLPNVPVQPVLLNGYGGGPGLANDEVSLDIEMVISMAPGVSKIYVFEGNITDDILNAMAASNQVKQLSASWSYAIDATSEQIFQQFAAQGQSFFNASGDSDAWLAGQIPTPCDDPYITIVGGTTLSTANNAWSSETVWNWGAELGIDGIGSGGGISTTYTIPSWQTNISMAANQGSTQFRNIPDVALTADNIFVMFGNGAQGKYGGTSCATPLWAGFMALVNQQAAATGKPPVGFVNPAIYAVGRGANSTSAFHDIATGNNTWSGSTTKFDAVTGYDLCTGWGTPAGQYLINALVNPEALFITPPSGFTSMGGFGGPFTITTQTFTLTNAGTSSFTWTLASTSAWLTVSSSGGTLTPSGPAATVTVSLNSVASNLVVGTYSATVWFTNVNDSVVQGRQFSLSVISLPVITTQPTNQAVLQGATAMFNVSATGGLPLFYQWKDNGTNLTDGGNISGSTTTNLIVSNVSAANVGTYTVTVTNIAGSVTSSNALLTIIPSPPVIIMQPTNQTVLVGWTAAFSVSAIGSTPLTYQWKKNGTNLVGQTSTNFTIVTVQTNNAGIYSVAVTNAYGSVISSNALLTVLVAPPCDPAPSGLVAMWEAEGNANDSIGTNNGTLLGGLGFTNGEVGQAFNFTNGIDGVLMAPSPSLAVQSLTIEAWIYPADVSIQRPIVEYSTAGGPGMVQFWYSWDGNGTQSGALFGLFRTPANGALQLATVGGLIPANQWSYVAMTFDYTSQTGFLYVNGVNVASNSYAGPGMLVPQTAIPVNLGYRPDTSDELYAGFRHAGKLDEVSIYNRALSPAEIAAIYNAGSAGKCPAPPTILVQPTNQTVAVGGTTTFTVQAVGTQPLGYQWSFNGTNVVGATNTLLTLNNVQTNQAGNYAVVVANAYGSVTSSNATLTVIAQPPVIIVQPFNQTVLVGWTAAFTVSATGSTPLTYQWKKNGTNLIGQTSTNFAIVNVQTNDAGNYSVAVTNAFGSVISSNAVLTVNPAPSCLTPPQGMAAWWRAENNTSDSINTNNGSFVGGMSYTAGEAGQAFAFNGNSGYITVSASPSLNLGTSNGLTIECWINPSAANSPGGPFIEWDSSSADGLQFWANGDGSLWVNIKKDPLNSYGLQTAGGVFVTNRWQHVAVTYDKQSGMAIIYTNGNVAALKNIGSITPDTTYALNLGRRTAACCGTGYYYGGLMDELSLYNRALSSSEIAAIYIAGSGGKCSASAPFIFTQPTNQTKVLSGTVIFTVQAVGTQPLNYQWKKNGANIGGGTSTNFTIVNVQTNDAAAYSVAITNAFGSMISSNAVLTVLAPPGITLQPASRTNLAGTTATFTNVAVGSLPLSFQWRKNASAMTDGGNVSGSASNILTLANVQDTDAAGYTVVVTNVVGSVTSSPAALVLLDPPTILSQPTNLTVTLTSNATFNVIASGSPILRYQWNLNGTNITGATNTSLALTNVRLNQAGGYTVWVTNSYGSILSSNATLVVNPLLYFVWNQIASPRFANTPFAVVIQAQNPTNGIVTNFTDTVILLSTNGLPVSPVVSGNFIQGVWTGAVTVAQTATNLVLQAMDNLGDSGLANPVNVISLPALLSSPSGSTLYIFWPVSPSGFVLETTAGLSPANWVSVTTPPFLIGNQYLLPIQMSGTNAFYRLRFNGQ